MFVIFYDVVCVCKWTHWSQGQGGGRIEGECEEDGGKMVDSDDAVLSQFVQLQVAEGLPRADDCDIWG